MTRKVLVSTFVPDSVSISTWSINDKSYPLQTGNTLSRSIITIIYQQDFGMKI